MTLMEGNTVLMKSAPTMLMKKEQFTSHKAMDSMDGGEILIQTMMNGFALIQKMLVMGLSIVKVQAT